MRAILAMSLALLGLAACADPIEPPPPVGPLPPIEPPAGEVTLTGMWAITTLDGQELPFLLRTEPSIKCGAVRMYITGSEMRIDSGGTAAWRWVYEAQCLRNHSWSGHGDDWMMGTWEMTGDRLHLSVDVDPPVYDRQNHFEIAGTFAEGTVVLDEGLPPFSGLGVSRLEYHKQE